MLKEDEKYDKENNISPWQDIVTLRYTTIDSLPPSDNWLKEKKWIWRNESDWKDYKRKIEEKKKI